MYAPAIGALVVGCAPSDEDNPAEELEFPSRNSRRTTHKPACAIESSKLTSSPPSSSSKQLATMARKHTCLRGRRSFERTGPPRTARNASAPPLAIERSTSTCASGSGTIAVHHTSRVLADR